VSYILYCYAECHVFYATILNVIMLNDVAPYVNHSFVAYSDIHLILFLFSAEIILQIFPLILLFVKQLILFKTPLFPAYLNLCGLWPGALP